MRSAVRWYLAVVLAAGGAVVVAAVVVDGPRFLVSPMFWAFLVIVVVLEGFSIGLPAAEDESEVTTSTTFSYALLLAGGVAPATLALVAGALANGITHRKAWYKVAFNAAQFALAAAASGIVLALTAPGHGLWGTPAAFTPAHLPGAAFGGAVFLLVNFLLLEVVVDLSSGVPVWTHARRNLSTAAGPMIVMLAMAPPVAIVAQSSLLFLPLFAVPIVALYRMSRIYLDKERQALHDGLTGLPNRTLFRDRVSQAVVALREQGMGAAVMVLDLDRFRAVNETLGHPAGDALLRIVASRAARSLRATDTVARLGGDDYGIVVRDADDAGAAVVAETLRVALLEPVEVAGVTLEVSASVGIAMALPGDDADELIRRAHAAVSRAAALQLGVAVYDPEVDPEASPETRARLALSNNLRSALAGGEIRVAYQPQVDLHDGAVLAVEALARWQHPTRGLLGAGDLIPTAESTGLIRQLSLLVLRTAAVEAGVWRREHGVDVRVSVNLAAQNLADAGLVSAVEGALEAAGLPADRLCLEITEGDLLAGPFDSGAVVAQLRRLGVSVSIDDFGTGMSNLARLKDLPVDELKIDKSFIDALPDERSVSFVRAMVQLGRELGLRVVAEGIETRSAAETLSSLAVDVGQGFLFAKPLWSDDFVAWHREGAGAPVRPPGWA